jgi:hypothetical protein
MVMKGQVISVGGKMQEAEAKAERAESYPWFWMEPDNLGIFCILHYPSYLLGPWVSTYVLPS